MQAEGEPMPTEVAISMTACSAFDHGRNAVLAQRGVLKTGFSPFCHVLATMCDGRLVCTALFSDSGAPDSQYPESPRRHGLRISCERRPEWTEWAQQKWYTSSVVSK